MLVRCFGTSFLLSQKLHTAYSGMRILQTNEHVVKKAIESTGQLIVIDNRGEHHLVVRYAFNTAIDVALLSVKAWEQEHAGLEFQSGNINIGTQVTHLFLSFVLYHF